MFLFHSWNDQLFVIPQDITGEIRKGDMMERPKMSPLDTEGHQR